MAKNLEHSYPKNVHILDQGYISTLLTQMSQPSCQQPQFNLSLKAIYRALFTEALNSELAYVDTEVQTRMAEQHPDILLKAQIFDFAQKAVVVDIARAGMLPSQVLFDELCSLVSPDNVRMDHIFASRVVNANQEVTHTELSSSKIGGDVDNATVFFPDPMGATGNSLCQVIETYKTQVQGTAKKWIGVHLIVTPEFIRKVTTTHPDVIIYAARVDRGLSEKKILKTAPGTHWDQECGLNSIQYIVPGAGGVGEIINNSYV